MEWLLCIGNVYTYKLLNVKVWELHDKTIRPDFWLQLLMIWCELISCCDDDLNVKCWTRWTRSSHHVSVFLERKKPASKCRKMHHQRVAMETAAAVAILCLCWRGLDHFQSAYTPSLLLNIHTEAPQCKCSSRAKSLKCQVYPAVGLLRQNLKQPKWNVFCTFKKKSSILFSFIFVVVNARDKEQESRK